MIATAASGIAYGKERSHIVMPAAKSLTLRQVIHWQRRIIKHDRWVIRTKNLHRAGVVKWHKRQLQWTTKELTQSLHLLHSLTYSSICFACWDRVAHCESTDTWDDDTGNGFYGGLQFTADTWIRAGGTRYADRADHATRVEQIIIASKLSLSDWPVCGAYY